MSRIAAAFAQCKQTCTADKVFQIGVSIGLVEIGRVVGTVFALLVTPIVVETLGFQAQHFAHRDAPAPSVEMAST